MNEFEKALLEASPESEYFVRMSADIADYVDILLKKQNMTQRDLAERMGKSESEVSKWLSGMHNLTLKSIAKMEDALGEPLFWVPCYLADYTDAETLLRIANEIIEDDAAIATATPHKASDVAKEFAMPTVAGFATSETGKNKIFSTKNKVNASFG